MIIFGKIYIFIIHLYAVSKFKKIIKIYWKKKIAENVKK